MTKSEKTDLIRSKFLEAGIDLVGFAPAIKLTLQTGNYIKWLESGFHHDMSYMTRNLEKREDLSLIFPDVKSVIVVGVNYYTNNVHPTDTNKIARYAWGDDYHTVIKEKLEKISEDIKATIPEFNSKIYVDTGPILEKQWALLAGIGWQGKNSLILNKKLGSYFFIGIILSNLELEYNSSVTDHCGKCTLCIESCPTNAIVSPKVLDSSKCISYWTIEAKPDKQIPKEISSNNPGWAFGCDICQEVCPWNQHLKATNNLAYQPRSNETEFNPEQINSMTTEEFNLRFRNSPIKRTKPEGIKRNLDSISSVEN